MDPNKVMEALNTKGINGACSFCGKNNWNIAQGIYAAVPVEESGDLMTGGGSLIPMIQMVCLHCGHIVQFNPVVLGLINNNSQ